MSNLKTRLMKNDHGPSESWKNGQETILVGNILNKYFSIYWIDRNSDLTEIWIHK